MKKREEKLRAIILMMITFAFIGLLSGCLSTAALDRADELKSEGFPVIITKVTTSAPNSAGGIDITIKFKNISDKTIKYAVFGVEAFNRVNDSARCEIRDKKYFYGRSTGPYKPNAIEASTWANAWYNNTISYAKIRLIEITYMDNTTESYKRTEAEKMVFNNGW